MLVKMKEDVDTYNGSHKEGDTVDLNPSVALAFVRQGRAEQVKPSKKVMESLDNQNGRPMEQQTVSVGALGESRVPPNPELEQAGRPQPRETLDAMRANQTANLAGDTSVTGADTKNLESAQERIAVENEGVTERKAVLNLTEQAQQAANKDKMAAARKIK